MTHCQLCMSPSVSNLSADISASTSSTSINLPSITHACELAQKQSAVGFISSFERIPLFYLHIRELSVSGVCLVPHTFDN